MAKRMVILKVTKAGSTMERYVRGLCESVVSEPGKGVVLVGFSKIARDKLDSIGGMHELNVYLTNSVDGRMARVLRVS
jgi:hypothetical protein